MGSFTKLIAPGVRAGYLLGEPSLIARIAKVAEDTYISPGYVAHAITWEWCRRGLLPAQIERLKALYAPRLAACRTAIEHYMPDAEATRPEGGFFLSLTLPPGVTTTEVRTAAARRNLNLADGLAFFPEAGRDGDGQRFLRLPFCALTPEQIDEGVRRLADTVREIRG
jgi:2-aminoadipate transaminase